MKLNKLFLAAFSAAALMVPVTGFAGALDRGPMQQRYNQAADEMIRVPGTVGMYEQDAQAALQQAGVSTNTRYDKKYKEDLAGMEGTVIDQEPGAGGITMLGSTVTITVYWPPAAGDLPPEGSDGQYGNEDAGQWQQPVDDGPPASYEQPPAPEPQWGAPSQPAAGGGWVPPPQPALAPVPQPTLAPQPAGPIVPGGPAPALNPRVPVGASVPAPQAVPAPAVPIIATPVPRTVTLVEPRSPAPAKTPIQQQLDQKVPARVDIRNKMKGVDRKITPTTGATTFTATPVPETVTLVNQQPPPAATFNATPVQQTVTPVNQSMTIAETPTQDGSCRSWYAIALDITAEAQRIAKELGCSLVKPESVWKQCIKHIDDIGQYVYFSAHLKKRWNRLVKKTSWAAIGPRDLTFGKTHNGRIFGTTGRMFITSVPINKGLVNIKLEKKAGKSRTSVTVCSYMPGGDRIKEWQFESPKGNKNKGQVWIKDLPNMDGKLLSIHLDGKSAADTFKYSIFLEKN